MCSVSDVEDDLKIPVTSVDAETLEKVLLFLLLHSKEPMNKIQRVSF